MNRGLDAKVAEIERLHATGHSQSEIARMFGASQTGIGKLMRRHGIQARPRGPLSPPRGPAHHAWKGTGATYSSFHERVETRRGKPSRCERCGTADPAKRYEWANLTGDYADPGDYERMCCSCHRRFDIARKKAGTHVGRADVERRVS